MKNPYLVAMRSESSLLLLFIKYCLSVQYLQLEEEKQWRNFVNFYLYTSTQFVGYSFLFINIETKTIFLNQKFDKLDTRFDLLGPSSVECSHNESMWTEIKLNFIEICHRITCNGFVAYFFLGRGVKQQV